MESPLFTKKNSEHKYLPLLILQYLQNVLKGTIDSGKLSINLSFY